MLLVHRQQQCYNIIRPHNYEIIRYSIQLPTFCGPCVGHNSEPCKTVCCRLTLAQNFILFLLFQLYPVYTLLTVIYIFPISATFLENTINHYFYETHLHWSHTISDGQQLTITKVLPPKKVQKVFSS